MLVYKDQLRMATAEEAAAAEVIGKEADQHSQERLHEPCYDLTEEYRNPKPVRNHKFGRAANVQGQTCSRMVCFLPPQALYGLLRVWGHTTQHFAHATAQEPAASPWHLGQGSLSHNGKGPETYEITNGGI